MHDPKTVERFNRMLNFLFDKMGLPRDPEDAKDAENPAREAFQLLESPAFRGVMKHLREEDIQAMATAVTEKDFRDAQASFNYGERYIERCYRMIRERGHLLAEEIAEEQLKPDYNEDNHD